MVYGGGFRVKNNSPKAGKPLSDVPRRSEATKRPRGVFAYMLECCDESIFTGLTNDLQATLDAYSCGLDRRAFTFHRRPVRLIWQQHFPLAHEGQAVERRIRDLTRPQKLALAQGDCEAIYALGRYIGRNLEHSYLSDSQPSPAASATAATAATAATTTAPPKPAHHPYGITQIR